MINNQMDSFELNINSIRDTLRKNGITGMDSIKHCIIFILCRYLNETRCELYDINKKYTFENIDKDDDNELIDDNNKLMEKFYNKTTNCFIGQVNKKLFFKMEFKLDDKNYLKIILNKLKKINIDQLELNFDIIGTIYELHLKTGSDSSMRDLGQYYSSRHIINYMIQLCDPKLKKNGQIETILDPTCGSGGFLTMSIKYLNKKYDNKINWGQNRNNIFGFDIDETVKNMTVLNLLLETGEIFKDTIHKQDTLKNDLTNPDSNEILKGADIILANEPFGLKNLIHAETCDKVKNLKIRGTKGEPLFLQLMAESLNIDGRCAAIVPEGVLFNESKLHQGTRKHIIDNYNLKKIILMNDSFFMNTNVKCAILFFLNTEEKTTEIEYYEIKYIDNKIDEKLLLTIKLDEIIANDYNLSINKYIKSNDKKITGLEYKKLTDICSFLPKSKRFASFGKASDESAIYPFYTSSSILSKYCDEADYNVESLIFGTGGNANIKISSNFSCSTDNFIITSNDSNIIKIRYLYYWFLANMNILDDFFHGATIKHLSKTDLENIDIPIISLELQYQIIKSLDIYYNQIESNNKSIKSYQDIKKTIIWSNTINCSEQTLGDLCNKKSGKSLSRDNMIDGDYPVIGGGESYGGYHNEFNYNEPLIFISRVGTAGYVSYLETGCYVTDLVGAFSIKDQDVVLYKCLYYIIKNMDNDIKQFINKTGAPSINMTNLMTNLKITIPSILVQRNIISQCEYYDKQIEKLEKENKLLESNNIIEIILQNISTNSESVNESEQNIINESIKPLIKKKVKSNTI